MARLGREDWLLAAGDVAARHGSPRSLVAAEAAARAAVVDQARASQAHVEADVVRAAARAASLDRDRAEVVDREGGRFCEDGEGADAFPRRDEVEMQRGLSRSSKGRRGALHLRTTRAEPRGGAA